MDINLFTPHGTVSQRSFIDANGLTTEDIFEIMHRARLLKSQAKFGERVSFLQGKVIAAITDVPSVRTKAALELAVKKAGGDIVYIATHEERRRSGESLFDIVHSLEVYGFDAFIVHLSDQSELERMVSQSKKPFICGLSDTNNPTQVMADLFTIWEKKGRLDGWKIAYLGRPTGILNSLLVASTKCGASVSVACPRDRFPEKRFVDSALQYGEVFLTEDPKEAVRGADVVYTEGYTDLEPDAREKEAEIFLPYRVTEELLSLSKPDVIFMHRMPVYRGLEVDENVAFGPRSTVLTQTENRLYVLQALLSLFTVQRQ